MKTSLVIVILILIGFATFADVVTATTAESQVAFTNSQSNFAWSPSAVVYQRADVVPVTVSIYRHGQGQVVLLSTISATASNIIWIPEGRYFFGTDSSLVLTSSVNNFTVQLHREAAHD